MKKIFLIAFMLTGAFTIGIFTLSPIIASNFMGSVDVTEQRVNANLMRVKVNGKWHNVPMVPLSDRLCTSEHPMFRRYCD